MIEALALMELDSVATGLAVIDALTKRARVVVWSAGVVEPGRFLILLTAPLGDLEEAWDTALNRASGTILDKVLIPFAHPAVERGLKGHREVDNTVECVGICETNSISSALIACDRALKDANVSLAGFRFSPGTQPRRHEPRPSRRAALMSTQNSGQDSRRGKTQRSSLSARTMKRARGTMSVKDRPLPDVSHSRMTATATKIYPFRQALSGLSMTIAFS